LLSLEKADVEWFLSVDSSNLPKESVAKGNPAFREITIDNKPIDFTNGFTDLHTISYNKILSGNGFGIKDAKTSLKIVNQINKYKG
jgi:UDP-N-acetyl-2-amino-2-deoxyglucuronate dehydrogenase